MEFRPMEEKDLDQVLAIEEGTFSMPWKREDFLKSIETPAHIYLVACQGDTVWGYCGMWGVAGEGQITNVAVKEELRGRGAGFGMLGCLLDRGLQEGLEAFTLEVRESNLPAIRLYEKLGFHSVGVRKGFYERPAEDAVIMWKLSR